MARMRMIRVLAVLVMIMKASFSNTTLFENLLSYVQFNSHTHTDKQCTRLTKLWFKFSTTIKITERHTTSVCSQPINSVWLYRLVVPFEGKERKKRHNTPMERIQKFRQTCWFQCKTRAISQTVWENRLATSGPTPSSWSWSRIWNGQKKEKSKRKFEKQRKKCVRNCDQVMKVTGYFFPVQDYTVW